MSCGKTRVNSLTHWGQHRKGSPALEQWLGFKQVLCNVSPSLQDTVDHDPVITGGALESQVKQRVPLLTVCRFTSLCFDNAFPCFFKLIIIGLFVHVSHRSIKAILAMEDLVESLGFPPRRCTPEIGEVSRLLWHRTNKETVKSHFNLKHYVWTTERWKDKAAHYTCLYTIGFMNP